MNLYENYVIFIIMYINKLSKIEEKRGETDAIARFWLDFKIYLAFLGQIFMAASVVR